MSTCIPSLRSRPIHFLGSNTLCRVGLALAACALVAASGDARAAGEPCNDLLMIGDFDAGTDGWVYSQVGAGVDVYFVAAPDDRLGDITSKAALVFDQSTLAGADYPFDPLLNKEGGCLPVKAGQEVRVGGWIRIPQDQDRTGTAQLAMAWFPSPECGAQPFFANTPVITTPGDWTPVDDTFEAPLGAGGVSVALHSRKNEAGGVFTSYYDDLYVCLPESGCTPLGVATAFAVAALDGRRRQRSHAKARNRMRAAGTERERGGES